MKEIKPGICGHCGKKIVLIPSASERAKKYGGKPSDYVKMFQYHADCTLKYRQSELSGLLVKLS
jgi:hypothetical protein